MAAGSWTLYVALLLAAAALVAWLYLRREPAGRGRVLLAALRLAAIALVLLLLFDPELPGGAARAGGDRTLLLLDASASMELPAAPGGSASRWDAALREAGRRDARILLFGDAARPSPRDSLPATPPGDARSLLVPALTAAAEAGAARVVVLTDGGIEDAAAASGWIARLGLGVEWVAIGAPLPGLALTAIEAPAWARADAPVPIEVEVSGTGGGPDSARLVVRQDGRALAEATFAPPSAGRSVRVPLAIRPAAPAGAGEVLLEVALEPGDAVSDDDRRTLALFVSPDPAGVALVSLQPDWEARFLLPVLERSLGLPARGFLRTGEHWVRVAEGAEAGERIEEADVARAVSRANLVVLHAPGRNPPPWVVEALRAAPRLLVLPGAAPTGGLPLPLELPAPEPADWFVAAAVPASPVAPGLGDVPGDLPPLALLRPVPAAGNAWAPLRVTRGRGGEPTPLLLAAAAGERRWAVALGDGYWRWAFRGGAARQLYERLWAAVGGWLVQEQAAAGAAVQPRRSVLSRGEPPTWLTPGLRPDSLRLQLASAGGTRDTVVIPAADDTLRGPLLPPGEYRWQATAFAGERAVRGSGNLLVERYSPESTRPPVQLEGITAARAVGERAGGAPRRPLHASPLPYVLVVLLLSAEWILRRRWGLR